MISMRELEEIVFPQATGRESFCMIVQTFLDDSADQTQSKVVVYAGFMGHKSQWDDLWRRWNKTLKKGGINYFRSTECRSLTGAFAKFRSQEHYPKPEGREASNNIRSDLKGIIEQTGVVGAAVGVLVSDYEEVLAMPEAKGKLNPDPFDAAFQSVMFECVREVKQGLGKHNKVTFVCDESTQADHLSGVYRRFKEKNPGIAKMVGGLTLLDDKQHPPLQAADLMAHLSRDLLLERAETGSNPQLKELRANVQLIAYWDKEHILAVLREQIPADLRSSFPILDP